MARPWCKHYRGMHEKDACEAGVAFSSLSNYGTTLFSTTCPCWGPSRGDCEFAEYPTADEMAACVAAIEARIEQVAKARKAIVEHLGGPWKKGALGGSVAGVIDCPVCGGQGTLRFSRSGYNGHIHAACTTGKCVHWME